MDGRTDCPSVKLNCTSHTLGMNAPNETMDGRTDGQTSLRPSVSYMEFDTYRSRLVFNCCFLDTFHKVV